MYKFLSVSQCSFSAFWQDENAISAHSSTGRMKSKILYILVLRLEISTNTTSFSLLLLEKMWFLKTGYIFICTVYSVFPMLFLQYCLGVSFYKSCLAQIGLIKSVFLNLAQVMRRRFFRSVLLIKETNRN